MDFPGVPAHGVTLGVSQQLPRLEMHIPRAVFIALMKTHAITGLQELHLKENLASHEAWHHCVSRTRTLLQIWEIIAVCAVPIHAGNVVFYPNVVLDLRR